MKKFIVLLFISIATAFAVLFFSNNNNLPVISQAKPEITIGNKQITVDIAKTSAQKALGLSGRSSLTDSDGMLFEFPEPNAIHGFWMKDMLIPIDIIWIKNAKVVFIHKNVEPEPGVADNQLKRYAPPAAVGDIDYVLEVAAGFSDKYKIEVDTSVDLSELF